MKTGRPKKEVDRNRIIDLASKGLIMSEIAAFCEVSHQTLRNNYFDCIERGRELMKGSLRKKQVEVALEGNPTMLIWLGKQELDQTDKQELKGSFTHELTDLTHLSDEQIGQVESLIETANAGAAQK